jgi:peptidoglycan/LPS O-acetylase OafA/YrhL
MTSPLRASRVPSLDGLRAASIIAVVIGHLSGSRGAPSWLSITETRYFDLAYFGVAVFFVISGYLITSLLMAELDRAGEVRVSRFYLRRVLRILPASGAYIAVVGALVLAGVLAIPARDFWHALTYTMNYERHPAWQLGHLWSLAVEEQFYLLWPFTLLLAGRRRAIWIALGVVCVVPWIRLVEWGSPASLGSTFETTADALALGCLFALCQTELQRRGWYRRLVDTRWLAPALITASVVLSAGPSQLALPIQSSLVHLAALAIVVRYVESPTADVGLLLNSRAFMYLGTLSYSLYLWQELFINRHSGAWTSTFPVDVGLAVACAVASYYLVERPFLALRPRAERWFGMEAGTRSGRSPSRELPPPASPDVAPTGSA